MRLSNTVKSLSQKKILYEPKKDITQNWKKSEYFVIPFFKMKRNLSILITISDKLL